MAKVALNIQKPITTALSQILRRAGISNFIRMQPLVLICIVLLLPRLKAKNLQTFKR